jgi:hypothetical protein
MIELPKSKYTNREISNAFDVAAGISRDTAICMSSDVESLRSKGINQFADAGGHDYTFEEAIDLGFHIASDSNKQLIQAAKDYLQSIDSRKPKFVRAILAIFNH